MVFGGAEKRAADRVGNPPLVRHFFGALLVLIREAIGAAVHADGRTATRPWITVQAVLSLLLSRGPSPIANGHLPGLDTAVERLPAVRRIWPEQSWFRPQLL